MFKNCIQDVEKRRKCLTREKEITERGVIYRTRDWSVSWRRLKKKLPAKKETNRAVGERERERERERELLISLEYDGKTPRRSSINTGYPSGITDNSYEAYLFI